MRSLLVWLLALPLLCQAAPGDSEFLAAREAAQRGQFGRVAELADGLRGHPLHAYVELWLLQSRLAALPQDDVRRYLDREAGQLVGNRLRGEWLRTLGRAGQWTIFDQDWPAMSDPDTELQCLQAQSAVQKDRRALEAHRQRWFVGRDLSEACTRLFDAMFAGGVLKDTDRWARIRLALAGGNTSLATALLQQAGAWNAGDSRKLDAALRDPSRYLADRGKASTRARADREIALFALGRVASATPDGAAATWEKLADGFPRDDREYGWSLIAVAGARKHAPQSLEWFRRGGDTRLDGNQIEWRARAALRVRDWPEVLRTVDAMEADYRERAVWRYWRARALRETGRGKEAVALLVALAGEHHFHGQLAAEELGPTVGAAPVEYRPSEEEVRVAARLPGLSRALAWYRLGLRYEGNLEWIWTVRDLDDVTLLGAAELARREGWYERAIATADRTKRLTNQELRYPTPYQDLLRARAREFDVDDAWLFGLVRQESRFNATARSPVGAAGLMQVMPDTARWVARKLGLKDWRPATDDTPDENVNFGTFYLKHILTQLDGSPVLASAGYNAGPRRAQGWRAPVPLEGAVYIDTIPFQETRDYVRRVMANTLQYARRFGRHDETLTGRIGTVPARTGGGS